MRKKTKRRSRKNEGTLREPQQNESTWILKWRRKTETKHSFSQPRRKRCSPSAGGNSDIRQQVKNKKIMLSRDV